MSSKKPSSSAGSNNKSIQYQQIQELTYTIEIKEKKIHFLQQQLKSLKDEFLIKSQKQQKQSDQLKKENEKLQLSMIELKQKQAQYWGQKIKQTHEKSRQHTTQKEEFYQNLIKQKQLRKIQSLVDMQSRYDNIIKQLKQQNQQLQNMLLNKQSPLTQINALSDRLTFGSNQYQQVHFGTGPDLLQHFSKQKQPESVAQVMKQKLQLMQEVMKIKQNYENLSKQLQLQKRHNRKMQTQADRMKRQYQQKLSTMKTTIKKLQNTITALEQKRHLQNQQSLKTINQLQELNQKLKLNLKQADQTYLKLLNTKITDKSPQPLTTIKSCNHAGLIAQMEKNITLKNNQIQTLKQKIKEWEKLFGFDKNIDQRFKDLGNVSNRTQNVYQNQKQRLSSGGQKHTKKGAKTNR